MANTFELISSVTVGSGGAASITFSSIPATYTDLCLKVSARANAVSIFTNMKLNINGGGTSWTYRNILGSGSGSPSSSTATNSFIGDFNGNGSTASTFNNMEIYLPNYANTSYAKSFSVDNVIENNATTAYTELVAGLWNSTSAITSLSLVGFSSETILEHSTAYLYGVKNA